MHGKDMEGQALMKLQNMCPNPAVCLHKSFEFLSSTSGQQMTDMTSCFTSSFAGNWTSPSIRANHALQLTPLLLLLLLFEQRIETHLFARV